MPEKLLIRYPRESDQDTFITAMQKSRLLHYPWVTTPDTEKTFQEYLLKYTKTNHLSYLIELDATIVGVININEIVRGCFQSGYLGFYAVSEYAGKGYMSKGLKLVLKQAFEVQQLHRLEANIQPKNINSINLVKSNHFRLEGYSPRYLKINGKWRDHERWAITIEDWLTSQS